MKRAALVSATIAVGLSAASAPPAAFGARAPTPRHHHARVYRDRHSVAGEERTPPSAVNSEAAHDTKTLDMGAKVDPPSAEWDCSNGDAGCSWHPYGWEGTRD